MNYIYGKGSAELLSALELTDDCPGAIMPELQEFRSYAAASNSKERTWREILATIMVKTAPSLEKKDGKRYVVLDISTQRIVDDCRGYGYKDPQKALSGYKFKCFAGLKQ